MRYYYIPTTYRGRKFGCGLRGAGIRGFGTLYAGTLHGGAASIIDPQAIVNELPEPAKTDAVEIITKAEETAKPVTIGKVRWSLWSSLKNAGKTVLNGAKTALDYAGKAYSNPLVRAGVNYALGTAARNYIPQIYTGLKKGIDNTGYSLYKSLGKRYGEQDQNLPLPPQNYPTPANYGEDEGDFESEHDNIPKPVESRKMRILKYILNYLTGNLGMGYYGGRRARFRKGSREAKAFMARLRSMRRRKRRRRRIGGSFKGVRNASIKQLYEVLNTNKIPIGTNLTMDVITGKDNEGNPIFEKKVVKKNKQ